MGFKKYGLLPKCFQQQTSFLMQEKIKVQMQKTITNKSVNENQKFPFVHVFIYQRNHDSIQKISSARKTLLFKVQEKKLSAFQRKTYRINKIIRKWASLFRAKKESKSGENGMEISTIYCMVPSIMTFPAIKIVIGIKHELFSSETDQAKPSVYMTKMLKHLIQLSQRVNKKYFSVAQKGLRLSTLKAFMVRQCLDNEENFTTLLYLYKHILNEPSVLERTRRSTEEETVPISVDYLRHLTSAIIACATIFGIALFILALGAAYLYYKRRQLGQFFNNVLNGGKTRKQSKSIDSQCDAPISLSRSFHLAQPQESKKKQTSLSIAARASSKVESDFVTIKEIYCSSDTEGGSSKMSPRSLTVRSRAYVFPSQSSESIESFCDDGCDVSSSQLSLSAEIIMENRNLNLTSTTPKEKEWVLVANQPDLCLRNNPEHRTSSGLLPQLNEATISRSKSETEIIRLSSSSSKVSRAVKSLTHICVVQNP
ncbi:uncharacterized protein LOC134393354 [Elgaria multicarinata webbii]|uniref:uncharacterized protein LOC134393354 n=1 Tax=Elgaria multicarinata webbii TaxID=159646 RepID=UPI002FCD3848